MRTVVAVDWLEQSCNAVKGVGRLFTHESLPLIHVVDLRPFEPLLFAQPLDHKNAGTFRQGMVAAGERLLEQTGAFIPFTIQSSLSESTRSGSRFRLCWNASVRLKRTWLRSDRRGVDDSRSSF